jgi:hypothetical protein
VSTQHSGINLETITQVIYVGVTPDFEKVKKQVLQSPLSLAKSSTSGKESNRTT